MAVYVDAAIWTWQGLTWCHLLADGTEELHRFAARIGIHRLSYQGPPRSANPHYDITAFERQRAIAAGATVCDREEIVAVLRLARAQTRKAAETAAQAHSAEPATNRA